MICAFLIPFIAFLAFLACLATSAGSLLSPTLSQQRLNGFNQMFLIKAAFDQIGIGPNLESPHLVRLTLHGGYDYHRYIPAPLAAPNLFSKCKPIHFRH